VLVRVAAVLQHGIHAVDTIAIPQLQHPLQVSNVLHSLIDIKNAISGCNGPPRININYQPLTLALLPCTAVIGEEPFSVEFTRRQRFVYFADLPLATQVLVVRNIAFAEMPQKGC
jgi:hypothetical protein